jgi:hypothetical protein
MDAVPSNRVGHAGVVPLLGVVLTSMRKGVYEPTGVEYPVAPVETRQR